MYYTTTIGIQTRMPSYACLVMAIMLCSVVTGVRAEFRVYDATLYKNKPDLSEFGIEYLPVVYGPELYRPQDREDKLPNRKHALSVIGRKIRPNVPLVLDVEHWPLRGIMRDDQQLTDNIKKYRRLIRWVRDKYPNVDVGYWQRVPLGGQRARTSPEGSPARAQWMNFVQRASVIGEDMDINFPAVYAVGRNETRWKKQFETVMDVSDELFDGPQIVFLNPRKSETTHYVRRKFWRLQLNYACIRADGIAIWGGWNGPTERRAQWNDDAPWWLETKAFMKTKVAECGRRRE